MTLVARNSTETLAFTAPTGSGITGSYDTMTGVLILTGTSSVADYQTALRSVTYENISDNPPATRTITFVVNDGTGPSAAVSKNITIASVPDQAPVITTTAGVTTYVEQLVVVDDGLTLSDADSTTLDGATVSITDAESTEFLYFIPIDGSGIDGFYDSMTGTLTLLGTASVADYQTTLRSVIYDKTGDNLPATRTITFTATDGTTTSASATKVIAVTAVNDAPTVVITSGDLTATPNTAVTLDPSITVSDPDNVTLAGATVTIIYGLEPDEDVLALSSPQDGITAIYESATGVLTLTGTAPVANYQNALRAVTYTNTAAISEWLTLHLHHRQRRRHRQRCRVPTDHRHHTRHRGTGGEHIAGRHVLYRAASPSGG